VSRYEFEKWENGSTNPKRLIDIKVNMAITAYYKEVIETPTTVTFSGSVSAQAAAGETVTITVTKPDGTKDVFTTTTQADLTFTVTRSYPAGIGYKAVAHIDEDAEYLAADSPEVTFDVAKAPRTITLSIS
jgi:hypothetical protein